jgi:hypothetical protein
VPIAKSAPAKSTPVAKKAPSIGPIVADIVARSKTIVEAAGSVAKAVPRDGRTLAIVSVVLVVIVAAFVGYRLMSGPAPTGIVVIDAAPWGAITSIEAESGSPVTLPASTSTPFYLTLPIGTYQVVVTGPPPESQPQRITVQVDEGVTTVTPVIRFRQLTPEEYFEQYLSAPTAPTLEQGLTPTELVPAAPPQLSPVPAPPSSTPPSSPVSTPAPVSNP